LRKVLYLLFALPLLDTKSYKGFYHDRVIFLFLPKWGLFKKNYKFRQVVPIWHDFICTNRHNLTRLCHVILKSCQLGTTSAMSYWSRANLAWFLPRHNFFILFILLFIYWVVSYVMLKINLIHNFLRELVLRNKKLDNHVWIVFDGNVIQ